MTCRVLVAEDNEAVNELIVASLGEEGYDCLPAYDGIEALRLFGEIAPAAVVLDLNLPRLHGLEVLREVKKARPDAVVVVLTGHGTEQTAIRALKLGADDYLQKPVRGTILVEALKKCLHRAERQRRAGAGSVAWARVPDDQLARVLFEAPTPLVYADPHGCVVAVNHAAARLLGEGSDALLGRRIEEFVDPVMRECWLDTVRKEAGSGRSYEAEVFLRGVGGEALPVSATAVAGPEKGHLVFSLRDLTRQKALELHYFEAKKLASLGRVVEGVAHEVRNPLVSVGGFARKLLEGFQGGGRERQYLEVILSDVQRLEHMVQEIEGYVTFTNRHRPGFSPVDLEAVLKGALSRVTARFPSEAVNVRWDRPVALPTLFGDEALLGELFEGLAENAFEAMPGGGNFSVSGEAEGNWARVRLSDTGIGIAEADLDEIFNPFVTTKTSGAGLGLAKAYMIVEEHAGTIEFESAPGRGTVCSVSLPVDRRRLRRSAP